MSTQISQQQSNGDVSQLAQMPLTLYVAIAVTLLISLLPNILVQEIGHSSTAWLLAAKFAVLAVCIVGSVVWIRIRPLRTYFIMLAVLYAAEWASGLVGQTAIWRNWFNGNGFATTMLSTQLLRLAVALVMVAVLFVIKRQRSQFFLVKGAVHAPVGRVSWLGVNQGMTWARFGTLAALCISLGTLVFVLMAGVPGENAVRQVLPLVPVILVLALMNSFSEEMSYRAALLTGLNGVLSNRQAILLTAAFFGIGHFYGVPYGIVGVVMASFLGWLLGKAMIETHGFFWPWVIHFFQDVIIFLFMAMGAVVAGG